MSSSLDAIRKCGLLDMITADESDHASLKGKARDSQGVLLHQLREFDRKAAAIAADPRLTAEGRQEKLKEVAEEHLGEVSKIKGFFLDPCRQAIARLEQQLQRECGLRQPDDAVSAIQAMEVRQYVSRLDPSAQSLFLQKVIESGDAVTLAGIVNTPPAMQTIPQRVLDEAQRIWAESRSPETFHALSEARHLHDVIAENVGDIERGLRQQAGTEGDLRQRLLHA